MKYKIWLVYQIAKLNNKAETLPRHKAVEIAMRFTTDQLNLIQRRVYERQTTI